MVAANNRNSEPDNCFCGLACHHLVDAASMAFRNPAIIHGLITTRSGGILGSEPPLAPDSGRQQVNWHSIQDRNDDYNKKFRAPAVYGTPDDLPAGGGPNANLQCPNAPFAMDGAAAPPIPNLQSPRSRCKGYSNSRTQRPGCA